MATTSSSAIERAGGPTMAGANAAEACEWPSSTSDIDDASSAGTLSEASEWRCSICFEDQSERGWRCPEDKAHVFCLACMRGHFQAVALPRCPASGCKYELQERDLKRAGATPKELEAFSSAQLGRALDKLNGSSAPGGGREVVVCCTNEMCDNRLMVAQAEPGKAGRERFVCPCGAKPFCTACKEAPFHFRARCGEVQELRKHWMDWIMRGRAKYSGEVRAANEYEKAQLRELDEGRKRHAELVEDEQWKAANCRRCPRCGRAVQRLEGCDSMVCGADYHGGNRQPGCGANFAFSSAPPYVAHAEPRREVRVGEGAPVYRGRDVFHPFVSCALCGRGKRGILGPRFQCIHCDNFNVCSACEPRVAEKHPKDHVFRIMFEPVWDRRNMRPALRLPAGTRVRVLHQAPGETGRAAAAPGALGVVLQESKEVISARKFEYSGSHGMWHAMPDPASKAIAEALAAGRGTTKIEGGRFTVDLGQMTQVGGSGRTREVREVGSESRAMQRPAVARAACHHFLKGWCKQGDMCRYAHTRYDDRGAAGSSGRGSSSSGDTNARRSGSSGGSAAAGSSAPPPPPPPPANLHLVRLDSGDEARVPLKRLSPVLKSHEEAGQLLGRIMKERHSA